MEMTQTDFAFLAIIFVALAFVVVAILQARSIMLLKDQVVASANGYSIVSRKLRCLEGILKPLDEKFDLGLEDKYRQMKLAQFYKPEELS